MTIEKCVRGLLVGLMVGCGWMAVDEQAGAQIRSDALPLIRVVGNHFEDEDGAPFRFRGLCFSDPDRLERVGQWNLAYFEAAKSWNANIVRFAVHPHAWRTRGRREYLKLLDQGIEWAGQLGMYVIIDWHSIGNLRTELFQAWNYQTTQTETLRFWKTIAARYRGNSVVACYELFNEPTQHNRQLGRLTWQEHSKLMEDLVIVVRAHDPDAICLVGGLNWAYDLSDVLERPIPLPGVAYVAHPYPQKREAPWEEKWEADFGYLAEHYPIVATEFGYIGAGERGAHVPVVGDEVYGQAIIDYFDKKGISWTVWCFDPHWSPMLIKNWDFEPTRQGKFFKAVLEKGTSDQTISSQAKANDRTD